MAVVLVYITGHNLWWSVSREKCKVVSIERERERTVERAMRLERERGERNGR